MANLTNYPLEDGFKTSLSQAWDGSTWAVNVTSTPSFTFPSGVTTYLVVNPGKSNMQIAEINAYNATAKTVTVNNITLEKGAGVNSTAQSHSVGSEVIISDNFQFWSDIKTAINSKLDDDVDFNWNSATDFAGIVAKSLTTTQRDALTPEEGMIIRNSTTWVLNQYIGGSWATFATGSVSNASTTVSGKVEVATDAEITAGTATWGTSSVLSVTPTQIKKSVSLKGAVTTIVEANEFLVNVSWEDKRISQTNLRNEFAASTTLKGTSELATDAEAAAGTDAERHITPAQSNMLNTYITAANKTTGTATFTEVITHWLGRTPSEIDLVIKEDSDSSSHGFYKDWNQAYIAQDTISDAISWTNWIWRLNQSSTKFFIVTVGTFTTTQLTLTFTANGWPDSDSISYLIKIR